MPTQPVYTQNKEKKPLVSFIVTYCNEPIAMLKECLRSILALSLNESERQIIIVDDGSDPSPINDLITLTDNIIYVRQPNRGLSRARNRGMELAEGRFIQFVDADDFLLTNTYEQCLDIIRYKEADMVLFRATSAEKSVPLSEAEGPVIGTHDPSQPARQRMLLSLRENHPARPALHGGYAARRRGVHAAADAAGGKPVCHRGESLSLPYTPRLHHPPY